MIKSMLAAAGALMALGGMHAAPEPQAATAEAKPTLQLWRLDCGNFTINDFNAFFSDTMAYKPGPKDIVSSCYLIRNRDQYLLWDTGIEAKYLKAESNPAQTLSLRRTLVDQLAQIGVKPEQINYVGISHFHHDHIGQAANFPKATLVIGRGDYDALKATPPHPQLRPDLIAPWISGGGKVEAHGSDIDIFEDGRVLMLNLPGHTPGHMGLLVRLSSGPVLLTGDLYHFTEQVPHKGVPPFNTDRADTLASMDRFDKLAKNLGAKVIIQHEPKDVAKLPAFPKAAE